MKDSKKSKAGKIGSSVRWSGHEKVITKQIRVYIDDYNILSSLASSCGSIADCVHFAISINSNCLFSCAKKSARPCKNR